MRFIFFFGRYYRLDTLQWRVCVTVYLQKIDLNGMHLKWLEHGFRALWQMTKCQLFSYIN